MAMTNVALETALKAALQRLVTALANKTAPDSLKLEGLTLVQVTEQILAGKAATAGTADNSLALGGKDLATIEAERAAALTAAIDALRTELEGSVAGVTKESIGLGDVVNYGVATEEQALAGAADKYVTAFLADKIAQAKIDELVGASPETLNTIQEIAAALNNDPDVINTMMTAIGTKETPEGAQAKADAAEAAAITAAATDAQTKADAAQAAAIAAAATDATTKADAAQQAAIEAAALDATSKVDAAAADLQVAIDGKLGKGEQAADSALLGGQTAAQIISAAQAGVDMSNVVVKGSNVDTNTITQGEGETATQVALSALIAQLQAGIAAAGDSADLEALQTSFNAFVAAKATSEDVIAGTDDAKYVTSLSAKAAIDAAVADLVGTAPEALNTINELAAALNNDPDIINTLMTQIGEKQTAAQVQSAIDASLVAVNTAINAVQETADSKLGATAQAVDSAQLEGSTKAQVVAEAAAAAKTAADLAYVAQGGNIDSNTITEGEGESAVQVALSTAIAQIKSSIAAVESGADGAVGDLQAAFDAFVAAKASAAEVIAGTDDAKYVTSVGVKASVDSAIAALVDGAPTALDTLKELAAALTNSEDEVAALVAVVDTKLGKTEQAADSLKLNGKTQAELTSAAADLDDATGVAGAGKFADAGQVAVKLAAVNTATATVASDLEALVIELTNAFDTAAADLEGTSGV